MGVTFEIQKVMTNIKYGKCQTSNLRLVKTIRVRKEDLEPWIVKSEIKASWSDKNDQLDALLRWFIWSETHELFSRLEQ